MRSLLKLAALAGLTSAAALIGVRSTPTGGGVWYRAQRKPSFTPPSGAFGPVWTAMYSLMTWSAWRVSKTPPSRERSQALALWGTQLALNSAWSWLFFGRHRKALALADLVALFATVLAYARTTNKVDRPAAWMMTPYLGWLAFAGLLNAEIVRRN